MRFVLAALFALFSTGALAQGSGLEPFIMDPTAIVAGNLTIANVSAQHTAVGFNISGTYTGTVPTNIAFEVNCQGSWAALSSPTIGGGNWTSTAADVSLSPAGTYTLCVRETQQTSIIAPTSNSITVTDAPDTITATNPGTLSASGSYTQAGTYLGTGYTPSAIDYSFDSTACGSAATSPTISGGNISFTNTAPSGTGSHTITLCDHSNHTIQGTSTSFTVNPSYTGPLDVVAGASACWMFSACSAAIGSGASANVIGLDRAADSHRCIIKIASTDQLATTVSGCTTSGDNGSSVSSWCSPNCNGNDGTSAINGWYDQSNSNELNGASAATFLTASCFTTLYCYTFSNGTYVSTTNGSAIVGSVFTIIAWVEPTTLTSGTNYAITACDANTGCSGGVEFRLVGQAGNATAKLNLVAQGVANVATSTCTISISAWHSVAITYDVSGNYAFYADGATCGSGTALQTFTWGTNKMMVGGINSNAQTEPFQGPMRGLVIYTSALSSANTEAIMGTGP